MIDNILRNLRTITGPLPGATEGTTVHHPSFKVRNTAFVMCADNTPDGTVDLWCKSTLEEQSALIANDPQRFFRPPYVGPRGWIGIRLHAPIDWTEVTEIVHDAYRLSASKTQLKQLDAGIEP